MIIHLSSLQILILNKIPSCWYNFPFLGRSRNFRNYPHVLCNLHASLWHDIHSCCTGTIWAFKKKSFLIILPQIFVFSWSIYHWRPQFSDGISTVHTLMKGGDKASGGSAFKMLVHPLLTRMGQHRQPLNVQWKQTFLQIRRVYSRIWSFGQRPFLLFW